ncbi:MAG: prepilin-type N-terminal cleavage/methylation domain-containing protein [Elusimicrobia bacterium]|nr:prepilin-type N-terminal cleavage/methylation domain-containing protein [Elusimicrobiota bacterium]
MTRLFHRRLSAGFTLVEMCVTVLIIAILVVTVSRVANIRVEKEQDHNAQLALIGIWEAQRRFYAYKATFTDDWKALGIADPSTTNKHFTFDVNATETNFNVIARRRNSNISFRIDKEGNVTPN